MQLFAHCAYLKKRMIATTISLYKVFKACKMQYTQLLRVLVTWHRNP